MCIRDSFTPAFKAKRITPKTVGIKAVGEGESEEKYPHNDRAINRIAFIKLAVCAFIL